MAEFNIKCPHCGVELESENDLTGEEVECPSCAKTFVVSQKPASKPKPKKNAKPRKKAEPEAAEEAPEAAEEEASDDAAGSKKAGKKKKSSGTARKSEKSETKAEKEKNGEKKEEKAEFTPGTWVVLCVILIGIPYLLAWLTGWHRTVFWISVPLNVFCCTLVPLGEKQSSVKMLGIIALAFTIWWGWDAHHKINSLSTSSPTAETTSSSNFNYSSEQPSETKITVNVTVSKKFSHGESWMYNCEYKLYADDECVATKNSRNMSVSFKVKVRKGAELRAELLPKNGFGGIAETAEAPQSWEKKIIASYSGQIIKIECW